MHSILRALIVYLFLLVLFRVVGRRSLAAITTFDFVLLLILGDATQQALLGNDFSILNALTVVATLASLDLVLGWAKDRWPSLDRRIEGLPVLLVVEGRTVAENMRREGIDRSEILEAAREAHGLTGMDEVRFAVLERSGQISVIPYSR